MTPETLLRLALEAALRVTAVAALVALVLLAARVKSSSVRHGAWVAVLVAMVLMPVLPYCVPAVAVPVPAPAQRSVEALTQFVSPFDPLPGTGDAASPAGTALIPVASREWSLALVPAVAAGPAGRPIWPSAVTATYALGFVFLASRLFVGWRQARRLVENRLRELPESIFESALVVTPLAVGVLVPRIILPAGWRAWPAEKLRAVLAHERAHVARRDPLIAFLAAVNRCVFWFHPLAWWLERKLATMAEDACDEAAMRELGERQSAAYAQVLLDMAEAARHAGGRLAWHGVGVVNGTSLIARRIDRILKGDLLREISRTRKTVVAVASAAAIFIVVACRQQASVSAAPLKEDPEITARFAAQQAQSEFYKKASAMSASQIEHLQAQWDQNPEDIEAARTLLTAYEPVYNGPTGTSPEFVARRRAITLWLIAHHPDHYLAARSAWMISAGDDVGRTQALRLWQAAVAKPDVNVKTLSNAATFLATVDRALAEQTLLRAQAMEPNGGRWIVDDYVWISSDWSDRLANLYAQTLWGIKAGPLAVGNNPIDPSTFTSEFAQQVRKKLDDTKDPLLLGNVAYALAQTRGRVIGLNSGSDSSKPIALSERYANRALALDPHQPMAHSALASLRRWEINQGRRALKLNISFWSAESHTATVAALAPADRFAVLADLADEAYMAAEYSDFESKRKDAEYPNTWFRTREEREEAALSAWAQSKQFARAALDLAPQFKDAPNYSSTIYGANIVLGLNALREGDVKTAIRGMQAALTAPPSEQLAYDQTGSLDSRMASYLLNCGERDAVANFFERSANLVLRDRDQRLKDAAAIRKGQMPMSYQYMVTPH